MPAYRALVIALLAAPLMIVTPAVAQDYLETNRAWHAYRADGADGPVCYMISAPVEQRGSYDQRGDAYVSVARRPGFEALVAVTFGFPVDGERSVTASVDDDADFALRVVGETAYADNAEGERAMVEAMRAGADLTVNAVSTGGTVVEDRYSLFGFTATLEAIADACP